MSSEAELPYQNAAYPSPSYPADKPLLTQPVAVAVHPSTESMPLLSPSARQPPDHIWLSLFSLLCCFWPVGLFALYKSLQVSDHYDKGRYTESMIASREAKKYNNIAILIGITLHVVIWVCCVILPGIIAGIVIAVTR